MATTISAKQQFIHPFVKIMDTFSLALVSSGLAENDILVSLLLVSKYLELIEWSSKIGTLRSLKFVLYKLIQLSVLKLRLFRLFFFPWSLSTYITFLIKHQHSRSLAKDRT